MPHRFYLPELLDGPRLTLRGSEAHHAVDVLRLKPGDQLAVFDGDGHEVLADIEAIGRRTVDVRVIPSLTATSAIAMPTLTLATAVPKGDRFRWLVEKATELGVDRVVPLLTEHSVVVPRAGKLKKLRQTIIAACKQSGRNRLLTLDEPVAWPQFVAREAACGTFLVAHPDGKRLGSLTHAAADAPVVAAVGPEGGFSDCELHVAVEAGAWLVHLGPHILRVETAAVAVAAAVAACERARPASL